MSKNRQNQLDNLSQEELNYLVDQLKKSQMETASTSAALTLSAPNKVDQLLKVGKLLLIILLCGAIIYFAWNIFQPSLDATNSITVEQIQDLATLATAKMHVKTIIQKEDNKLFGRDIPINIPGTKSVLFIVVPAEVVAGVNLESLTEKDFTVNEEDRTITLTLPHATFIQEPALDMDNTQAYTNDGIFRGAASIEEGYELAAEASTIVKQEAIDVGIFETAEKNAEQILHQFFEELGYTSVITFR